MIVWYTFAVIQCFVSGNTQKQSCFYSSSHKQFNKWLLRYAWSSVIMLSALWLWCIITYVYIIAKQGLILSSHVNKSCIFSSNRSCSYDLIIIWSRFSWQTRTKRNIKRVLAGCQMLWEVGSEVLLPTAAAWQIQSLLSISCALYEGVLLLLSSCPSEHFMTVPWV